jgi:hypothetical protein
MLLDATPGQGEWFNLLRPDASCLRQTPAMRDVVENGPVEGGAHYFFLISSA